MSEYLAEAVALASGAKEASAALAYADGGVKNAALARLAERLEADRKSLLAANVKDIAAARKDGLADARVDRLRLTPARLADMAAGVRQIAALPDPVGQVLDGWVRPDGLRLRRVRVPLGTILIIYEARPNVTVDAAALCLKAGNAVVLRGGREARHSNLALGAAVSRALAAAGLPAEAAQVVRNPDRALVPALLAQRDYIDLAIPRGGRGLVETVDEHARMPVLKHLDGVCHVYVDAAADLDMAGQIAFNAKVQRPGTCNAAETLLVHAAAAPAFLPGLAKRLAAAGVRLRADPAARRIIGRRARTLAATEDDWRAEYLALELAVAVVPDLDSAIRHINRYGSRHTEAIVTRDLAAAHRFQREVDAASVMVNASTRLADGFEYGLGAEIGISTDKFHARGPVGLEGLTTYKWLVDGDGHVRQ